MRNNPAHGAKLEYTEHFKKYSRLEKLRRFFPLARNKIYKQFCVQPYNANFLKEQIPTFTENIDKFLDMGGKLVKNFKWEQDFSHL